MKKFFLLLLGIILITSCSSDSESVNFNDSTANSENYRLKSGTIDPVLKDLYIRMINSQSYIDYNNALIEYSQKLGSEIPESECDSSTDILHWVANNLSKTHFDSYLEAVDELGEVNALCSASIAANNSFHLYLGGAESGALLPILGEIQPVPTRCPNCRAQFLNCSSAADSAYSSAVSAAAKKLREGEMNSAGYSDACLAADLKWRQASETCMRRFNICCIGG